MHLNQHRFGISTIDTGFQRPGLVASHLIEQNGHAALVDVGVSAGISVLLDALKQRQIALEKVDYVMVTHVHLDHAGAAGALIALCPNAQLVVHPRGARHMQDPEKLIAGATAVYGEQIFLERFGEVLATAKERILIADDQFELDFHGRVFRFFDTPGHARHHFCLWDEQSNSVFTGDTFGLAYPELHSDQGAFIFPTTTPVQFDPVALHASIDKIAGLKPSRAFLTHFGLLENPSQYCDTLHHHIDAFVAMAEAAASDQVPLAQGIFQRLQSHLFQALRKHGCRLSDTQLMFLLEMDIGLNAQGLAHWLQQTGRAV